MGGGFGRCLAVDLAGEASAGLAVPSENRMRPAGGRAVTGRLLRAVPAGPGRAEDGHALPGGVREA